MRTSPSVELLVLPEEYGRADRGRGSLVQKRCLDHDKHVRGPAGRYRRHHACGTICTISHDRCITIRLVIWVHYQDCCVGRHKLPALDIGMRGSSPNCRRARVAGRPRCLMMIHHLLLSIHLSPIYHVRPAQIPSPCPTVYSNTANPSPSHAAHDYTGRRAADTR